MNIVFPFTVAKAVYSLFGRIPDSVTIRFFSVELKICPLLTTDDLALKVKNIFKTANIFITDSQVSEICMSDEFSTEFVKQLVQVAAVKVWGDPFYVKFMLIIWPDLHRTFIILGFFLLASSVALHVLVNILKKFNIPLPNKVEVQENLLNKEHPAFILSDAPVFLNETLLLLTKTPKRVKFP